MIATVIDTKGVEPGHSCPVLAGFIGEDAEDRAVEFIDGQPEAESGRYGLDLSPGTRIQVAVKDMCAGDVLVPTGACLLGSRSLKGTGLPYPSAGTRTPAGKLDVILRHPNGRLREATWGRYTKVTVVRHTEGDR